MNNIESQEVIRWAKDFLQLAEKEINPTEVKEQKKYAILVKNPSDKILLSKLLDESSQIRDSKKLAERMKLLLEKYETPKFFSSSDQLLLKLFTSFGYWFDFISVPLFKKRLRADTANVIINEREDLLRKHLNTRYASNIGQNVNLLGEVVLGDAEANNRYEHYIAALKDPNINYISIKISGIYAQINPLNYEENRKELTERLTKIYQTAIENPHTDKEGNTHPKFVNLDMEEYKDTELTIDLFTSVLSLPQFQKLTAGIVVQAYLPDASLFQDRLLDFAHKRATDGGAPIKMRLVKGANLQMETIISSLRGWESPVLDTKIEVDANYLHILDKALLPENAKVLKVGVASHNFFTIAYAHLLAQKNGTSAHLTFEMLEGMANHLPRVMRQLDKQIILYTPVVSDEHFLNAVSYLVRRIDENTGEDNFLRYSFSLKADSEEWQFLQKQFEEAYALKGKILSTPKRHQNRNIPIAESEIPTTFINEPDTDFDLLENKQWADSIREKWQKETDNKGYKIPVQVGENFIEKGKSKIFYDRNRSEKVEVCTLYMATETQISEIIEIAQNDQSEWRKTSLATREKLLNKVADNLSNHRNDLIGCMSAITGKTFMEGDVEISEAIDFCRYYPHSMHTFDNLKTVKYSPKGIVLVIPPWNFPTAIPVGGVAAALAGGNTVILKPATVAYPIAWEFAQQFWKAGIPKDALQIVSPESRAGLTTLTKHPNIKHIILTGGTDTAFRILENNPTCPLSAETGGKNAIILTASGDRDHAILSIVKSAFSNAGQKCSACSLLLVEDSIYDDPTFREKLTDAVQSMHTGSAWNGGNIVGPMVTNNNDKMLHAIDNLEEGEEWLVAPEFLDKERYILKPTVKWGVKSGSYTFETELFGPVLSVVRFTTLTEAIEMVNSGEYGLTSGIHSLDERERALWKSKIEAGNLYINRGITGAIVQRQPFGGMKRSAFGGGTKAGGENYVSCFVNFEETDHKATQTIKLADNNPFAEVLPKEDFARYKDAIASFSKNWNTLFSQERLTQELIGERNTFRYLPLKSILFRVLPDDDLCDVLIVITAANVAHTPITLSITTTDEKIAILKDIPASECLVLIQNEEEFLSAIDSYDRVRTCTNQLPKSYHIKAATLGKYIATQKPLTEGRIELLHYLKEQSISYEYHRYGSFTNEIE